MAREWNTPVREPWNGTIKASLEAIDKHNEIYFATNNPEHLEAAKILRSYVCFLKNLIRSLEIKVTYKVD